MKLHNTLTGSNDELAPLNGKKIGLYTCGLTVYSQPQIGNWVAYIYADVLTRVLIANGYEVTRVQNITDVGHLVSDEDDGEDKMEKGARAANLTAWDVAEKFIKIADEEAYEQLGLLRPDHMPRATDYIPQQIAFVQELEKKGFTYKIEDGVYFDTSKLSDYGKLARLDIAGLQSGARVTDSGKKHPTDFALWKFSPADAKRDMEWDSPWGTGFPGWHLECSVIARALLGDTLDIHSGGIDHIPVHHTNEIAQSETVTGKPLSRHWFHNNHMKVDGTKLSKSLGNSYALADIADRGYDLDAFKLLVLSSHYRTEGNFTWEILDAQANRLRNWRNVAALRHQTHDTLRDDDEKSSDERSVSLLATSQAVLEALSDDLDTPAALAIIDEAFGRLESRTPDDIHRHALVQLLEMIDELLGLQLLSSTPDITDEQKHVIISRSRARDNKDWAESDRLRDELTAEGIAVRDTARGTVWSFI